ncbi:hypothetical protein SEA_BOMBITAS_208 [Mycobacterium phage Bombitas]|uniref:Uncharacterized protein n=2 Tax=Omegavirus courthouse TaxID=1089119 RepID=G8I5T2_9CAUD|nr:hypothetical protein CM09_gp197 [Mycobacterium phage Courthouse]YP_009205358.1 hypothetical protein AVT17_gp202 [Mycobacterium phage Ariel]ATS93060.1 hypothetical protein SEA_SUPERPHIKIMAN_222 [Mycobacterium phage Superphikiman]WNM72763.1 hypothetical protein SEA_BOMBITAS_208 [Mycobacterium phage Bombitas]AER48076.1 hypothetical protein COURTHOUSE_227 [Mycobacterium phage Courthouse]AIM50105.1 hypothetical protein PBI_ARIEL_230 [Mycobacterium phage Ariel]
MNRYAIATLTTIAIPIAMAMGIGMAYVNPLTQPTDQYVTSEKMK